MPVNFDIDHLLAVAKQHGEDSEPDHEVGDLQAFLRAAWARMNEQQMAAFFADPVVAQTYEAATGNKLSDIFPNSPFQAARVITDVDVAHVERVLRIRPDATWDSLDKKHLLAEVMTGGGVRTDIAVTPAPAAAPRRMRPR
jgi:hypothetical protein